ncbi:GntR family transcriptional regulator [Frigoribacterium sp. 2-23]|uniref:GntR family transcriptional regulator n=1 Tax=Frigoribacterium sp. 2-23 TaxID=3415006 RepID=UPI003C6F5C58
MPVPASQPSAERRLLRETVRDRIREAILDGTLEPGERLHDEELIAWLQVSRTPIREALGELASAGLIEMAPNRYTRVMTPDPDEVLDAIQTLGVILGGVTRLATPDLPTAARTSATSLIEDATKAVAARDGAAWNSINLELFDLFAEHCQNTLLVELYRSTRDGLSYKLRAPGLVDILDWDDLAGHYADLAEAVTSHDAVGAELATESIHHLPHRPVA